MPPDPRRRSTRNPTQPQARDLARTVVQDLWHRCHPLSGMSQRKDVHHSAAASLSMPQPLAVEINLMNQRITNSPASCENDILFRHGPLLPKNTHLPSSRPSGDLFIKTWVPALNPYPYQCPKKAPYLPAC